MRRIREQEPVILLHLIPFAPMCQFIAHEIELLSRMGKHIQIQRAQLREFLFIGTPHLIDDGRLAMHDLIMAEFDEETLGIEIRHREGDVVVMPFAVHRILLQIVERIVHPAQIPFVVKAKPALQRALGHIREIGGILRDEHDLALVFLIEHEVHALDKVERAFIDA